MKKNYYLKSVLTLMLFVTSIFAFQTKADAVVIDGVAYDILNEEAKTAQVVALPGGVKYTDTLTIAAEVTIDEETYAVIKIGNGSLRDAPALTGVIIPEGLEIIGNSSFASCTGITSLELPASVNSIEDWAFYGCSNLETINIPDGVTAITAHTFQQSGLTAIELPASVTSLKVCAFQDAKKLAAINLENIREIGGYALYATAISSVELTDVTSIASEAFRNCPNLVSFKLKKEEETAFSILGWTFAGSTLLETVELPEGLTTIDTGTFSGCTALESLTIPESVTLIKDWSLEKTGLKRVYVFWDDPDGITIENSAFGSGSGKADFAWKVHHSLADVYGETWKEFPVVLYTDAGEVIVFEGIAYRAMNTNNEAEVIALPKESSDAPQVRYTGTLTIAENVSFNGADYAVIKIGNGSLRDAPELTEVIIPEGLKIIGNSSFASCTGLTSLELPTSVNSIEDWAFYGCSNLETINIPDGVTAITAHTFQQSGLTAIELPASVTSLKVCAFQDAEKLASINLENITEMAGWVLAGTAITSAVLSDGITKIETGTFSGCSLLESLTIPNSVATIDAWAIEKTGLKEIYISWEDTEDVNINYWAFGDSDGRFSFVWMVPADLADVYGETWWNCPVVLVGETGIKTIAKSTIKLINQKGAIRIDAGSHLNGTVSVYSLNGVKLYTRSGQIDNTTVELPVGIYVVKITSSEGMMTAKAIIN